MPADLTVTFAPRNDFSGVLLPPQLTYVVGPYSFSRIGGPKKCVIRASGNRRELEQLDNLVGCGVRIRTMYGRQVWWGLVDDPQIDAGSGTAELRCIGYFDTLDDYYYTNSNGLVENMSAGGEKANIGAGDDVRVISQSVQLGAGTWVCNRAGFRLWKVNLPTDDIIVDFRSGSETGTLLTSITFANSLFTGSPAGGGYFDAVMPTPVTLSTTPIFMNVRRSSGVLDTTHFWQIELARGNSFDNGTLKSNRAGTWYTGAFLGDATPTGADLLFKLTGDVETTTQLRDAIIAKSEYITSVSVLDASGLFTVPYQVDDIRLLAWVQDMIERGASSGARYIVEVTPAREMLIYLDTNGPGKSRPHTLYGSLRRTSSRSAMANKVAVAYTSQIGDGSSTGGTRGTTAWASDADAIAEFHTRELLMPESSADPLTADSVRNAELAARKYPVSSATLSDATMLTLIGSYGEPVDPSLCPAGVWARLVDIESARVKIDSVRDTALGFIESAEYDGVTGRYTPTFQKVPNVYVVGGYEAA